MTIQQLAGYTIGITADRRWEEQAELFTRRGARVVHGRSIRTLPLGPEGAVRDATAALVAHPPDVVVFTTGVGVRGWFAVAESVGQGEALRSALAGARVHVRGGKAAGAAVTLGLDIAWRAPTDRASEIVDHLVAERGAGAGAEGRTPPIRVAVQLDGSSDAHLLDLLRARGFDVVGVPVYRWTVPTDAFPAVRLATAVAERTVDAVTFTAAPAVSNFFALARDAGVADAMLTAMNDGVVDVVCVGEVCAERAREAGVARCLVPATPRLGAMVHACAETFAARRRRLRMGGHDVVVQGRLVMVNGNDPEVLSDRERGVLDVLAERPGAVVSKAALLRGVWGPGEKDEHVVEVTVGRLRRRLGDAGIGVETVVRRGYRLGGS